MHKIYFLVALVMLISMISITASSPINGSSTGLSDQMPDKSFQESYNSTSIASNEENSTSTTTTNWRLIYRQREREEQLMLIQLRILNGLGISQPPNISTNVFSEQERARIRNIFHKVLNKTEKKFTNSQPNVQRLQSFYPSCFMPKKIERRISERRNKSYMYFRVDQALGQGVEVNSAVLRIWKNDVSSKEENLVTESHHPWFGKPQYEADVEQIFKTNVYVLIQPMKRSKRMKRRLICSKINYAGDSGWQEFDVKSAVKLWLKGYRNLGFEIRVQNILGVPQDPSEMYSLINCSTLEKSNDKENIKPLPNFIKLQNYGEITGNESLHIDNETYPTLDLHTTYLKNMDPTGDQYIKHVISIEEAKAAFASNDSETTFIRSTRDKRSSSCTCHKQDFEFDIDEIGLEFLVEPKVLNVSVCTDGSTDAANKGRCRAKETSDISFKYEGIEGELLDLTLPGMNDTRCECSHDG